MKYDISTSFTAHFLPMGAASVWGPKIAALLLSIKGSVLKYEKEFQGDTSFYVVYLRCCLHAVDVICLLAGYGESWTFTH